MTITKTTCNDLPYSLQVVLQGFLQYAQLVDDTNGREWHVHMSIMSPPQSVPVPTRTTAYSCTDHFALIH